MTARKPLDELKQLQEYGQETEVEDRTPKQTDTKVAPSRRGKRHISGYFQPEVLKQVKIICAEEEKTVNQVLAEALNALFINKGKPPIA